MNNTELRALTPTNVKHVHSRTTVSNDNDKRTSHDVSYLYSVKQTLNNFLDAFGFVEFEIKYSQDKDAGTEYLILNGNGGKASISLELHIFSCYCDGDHPDGVPPF